MAKVVQMNDGRWQWADFRPNVNGSAVFATGFVSFATESEAQAELNAHAAAPLDDRNHWVRTKDDLNRLIRAACESHDACENVEFGEVYWHSPDEMGCNWSVNWARGDAGEVRACRNATYTTMVNLRTFFNIEDEG